MSWMAGCGKEMLTPNAQGILMLGYAYLGNRVEGIKSPLHARCILLRSKVDQDDIVYCNLELCFITQALKDKIMDLISEDSSLPKWTEAQVVVAAQHTHSGPSGYDHHAYYNVPSQGFVPEILESLAFKTYLAIKQAYQDLSPATLYFDETEIGEEIDIAFNRSLQAFVRNPEVKNKSIDFRGATHRVMSQLEIHKNGKISGLINWFAVHATSVSRENKLICGDNKGYASLFMEDFLKENGVEHPVAIFAQACSGDVSPNFRTNPQNTHENTGPTDDQYENAKINGKLHVDFSKKIFSSLNKLELEDKLDYELVYEDMGRAPLDSDFMPKTTSPGCFGIAFIEGTCDGKGVPPIEATALKMTSRFIQWLEMNVTAKRNFNEKNNIELKYNNQFPKDIFCETRNHRVMGFKNLKFLPIPGVFDPLVATFKKMYSNGSLNENSWVQDVLPFHLMRIGQLAIASLPFEPTTMCGVRLRELLSNRWGKDLGVSKYLAVGYTNSYSGYVVTPEEYMEKRYESGHTLYGRYTLPAIMAIFSKMADEMTKKKEDRHLEWSKTPSRFSKETLAKRTYIHRDENGEHQQSAHFS